MAGRFSVEAVFKAVDRITAPVSRMQNRVGKFTRGMARGFRKVDRAIGKMLSGMKTVALFTTGALTVAATGAALAVKSLADEADALAKQSRRLDFPIEDLQEWKFAAEQSGVSTELFDKSIGAFSKRLGEARAGTGALVTILKKSNPELLKQVTSADNVADAFDLYLKAMRETPNATDRAALAAAGFSRAGLKMANIVDNSADAISKLRKEQRENGVLTKQQAENAEAFNDSMNSLMRSITGLRDTVLAPLLPMLTSFATKTREWVIANKELIATGIADFIKGAIPRLKAFAGFIKDAANFVFKLGSGIGIMAAKIVGAFERVVNSAAFKAIVRAVQATKEFLGGPGGFGADFDPDDYGDASPPVVSPQERTARSVEESRTTETTEVILTAEQGTAARVANRSKMGRGLTLQSSGAF